MGVESTNSIRSFASLFKNTGDLATAIPTGYTIIHYNTSYTLVSTTTYTDLSSTTTLSDAGYYKVQINGAPITFDMWAWGSGGAQGGGPGPGGGGAGGGVRGRKEFLVGNSFTILVAESATIPSPGSGSGAWPDGGGWTSTRYQGAGGGSSRIGDGLIPFSTINDTPTSYLLIGGGGGGGTDYLTAGPSTMGGQGGYPSGQPGGSYYPFDGARFGLGGTQSAGGNGGSAGRRPAGSPGSKYAGGAGGNLDGGGGGGGGYYGGGGAGGYYAHGGGGSGYIDPSLTNTASFTATTGYTQHYLASDDPSNIGIKPATAGDRDNGGVVILRPVV